MELNLISCDHADEDFIDIEFDSSTSFFCYSPSSREFEFQMCSNSLEQEPVTSPADELFYQGKLLPLHLPPRLQMVGKLLQNSSNSTNDRKINCFQENSTTPFSITAADTNGVPLDSDIKTQVSPCASSEVLGFIADYPKKPWSKRLKLIQRSALALKLKKSRAYLKSLFRKSSGCSGHTCTAQAPKINGEEEAVSSKADEECLNKYMKLVLKPHPFGHVRWDGHQNGNTIASRTGTDKESVDGDCIMSNGINRSRSFSSGKKMASRIKSSSLSSLSFSSSSSSSSLSGVSSCGFYEVNLLRRSNSTNSEIESAIQGAIAHCKRSAGILIAQKRVYN